MSEETLIEEAVAEPTPPPAREAVVKEPGNPVTDDPYEFDQCTITIQIMLLPDDGNENGREVVVGVRNHLDSPIIRAFRLNEVPLASPVTELLEELKADLSLRAVAHKMREAEKASKPKPAPRTQTVQTIKAPDTKQVGREPTNQQMSLFQ